ncbi:hypothetical protein KC19_VG242400 [Ceratodon purpureus]|uniref:Uncharacterized protein n=1 Tax=Ceratodon purpureus TaxID=3225 RepID=A0A8T0HT63_CERPU|nr:hypothetical protein KC19_VG242400 [Ceratodon purpureus]
METVFLSLRHSRPSEVPRQTLSMGPLLCCVELRSCAAEAAPHAPILSLLASLLVLHESPSLPPPWPI